jgi:hypothetical protein
MLSNESRSKRGNNQTSNQTNNKEIKSNNTTKYKRISEH